MTGIKEAKLFTVLSKARSRGSSNGITKCQVENKESDSSYIQLHCGTPSQQDVMDATGLQAVEGQPDKCLEEIY